MLIKHIVQNLIKHTASDHSRQPEEKNSSVSIVTVQWRLQPLLQMIPHVLLASTWETNFKGSRMLSSGWTFAT